MLVIELDAQSWRTCEDYANALRKALRSPEWHGSNVDAFFDSMVVGDINEINPPYKIIIKNTKNLSEKIIEEIEALKKSLPRSWANEEDEIKIIIEP
ncbi:MAG: barstar family protein [Alphaproteobacteria bacterium]|nr:barstar family protein [Alphaproteobacteria bacterium]